MVESSPPPPLSIACAGVNSPLLRWRAETRRYGDQSEKPSDSDANLADEMADVLWVLVALANQTGVVLTDAFHRNMEKKTQRDSERHTNNPKLK